MRAEIEVVSSQLNKTNIVGNINLFNLFLPLILKGKAKKVVTISSGLGDIDFTNQTDTATGTLYGAFKAALNLVVAKYSAEFKKDGVLFFTMSPGLVDVGHFDNRMCISRFFEIELLLIYACLTVPPVYLEKVQAFAAKLQAYAPHFKGPSTVEQSVKDIISVWERASIETGYAGVFVSHYGNKQWV